MGLKRVKEEFHSVFHPGFLLCETPPKTSYGSMEKEYQKEQGALN